MSRAERNSITLLSIISGSLKTIEDFDLSPDNRATVLYAIETCDKLIFDYPCCSWTKRALDKVTKSIEQYDDILKGLPGQKYTAILLVSMSSQILTDLLERIKDKAKRKLIEPLLEAVTALHDKLDPKGNKLDDYKNADKLLKHVYGIIDF